MPTYGYQCNKCGHTFEVIQKMTDEAIKDCEKCGGEVRRLLYPVGILFKGSGFHVNDYRKPEGKREDEGKTSEDVAPKEPAKSAAEGE